MTAVCEDSGGVDRWSPDPDDLSCSQPGPAVIGQGMLGTVCFLVAKNTYNGVPSAIL